ncbi:ATPase [Pseudomonas sp. EL_65y_Pfl2_R95]|uniref:ATPase n=1 Tax=Pseudomonas sp. EL_65y_Pfl2_R95 TaxID=3088698 RepID=UPI0030D8D7E0
MRNDANDEFDDVPSLSAGTREEEEYVPPRREPAADIAPRRAAAPVKKASTGPLWALVGALMIAFAGLGWWSFQQISLMEQQLVATQESFARISEEAAGRIKDISGKVVATESNITTGSEALKLQVKQLEGKLADLNKQQLGSSGQQGDLTKRLDEFSSALKAQQDANAELSKALKALAVEQTALTAAQAELKGSIGEQAKLSGQVKDLAADVQGLKKVANPTQAINDLQDELLVLKSTLDNRPTPAPAAKSNTAEFDAFRAQVTRTTSTLQSQIRNLQDQIDAK